MDYDEGRWPYFCTITFNRFLEGNEAVSSSPCLAFARSEEEAIGMALAYGKRGWPGATGYQAAATKMDESTILRITNLGLSILEEEHVTNAE